MTFILKQILPIENIVLDINCSSKKRVFEQAGLIFENNCGIARSDVSENLLAGEILGSSSLGHGVAVPYGKIINLKNPLAALIRLSNSIPFESKDNIPVNLFFFLLIPEKFKKEHLNLLTELDKMFSSKSFCENLNNEKNPLSILDKISNWKY